MTTSWPRIALLYVIGVLAAGQLGVLPALLASLQRDLGLSLAMAGMAVSIVTMVGALIGLPAGGWSERMGHARALAIGLLIMAVAALSCAVANDAVVLLIARAFAGVGYLLVVVAGPSLMALSAQQRHQPLALSLWGTFVPVGIALAGLATSHFTDWRAIFALDGVLLILALIVALAALRKVPSSQVQRRHAISFAALKPSLPLALGFFCFALLFLALAGLLPTYLIDRRGVEPANSGRIAALATAAGIVGSLAAGGLMRRGFSPAMLATVGLLASTALAALALSVEMPLWLVVTGFTAAFAIGGLVPAAVFASVPMVAADTRAIGPINGLLAQAGSLGSLAGPPLLALWVDATSWATAPILLLAIAALGAASASSRRPRR